MTTLNARNLSLNEVRQLLGLQEQYDGLFTSLLSLELLTEFEQQELVQIRDDFLYYLRAGKVSEGQIKFLVVGPLLRLAGLYRHPIQITMEQGIADIAIEDEDTVITGRYDILSINRATSIANHGFLWVLVIEAKNSQVEALAGLPQLLTYAYQSLKHQESVWGLTTNGVRYQFVHVRQGNPPTYLYLPELNLIDSERLTQLLQVLKAICKL